MITLTDIYAMAFEIAEKRVSGELFMAPDYDRAIEAWLKNGGDPLRLPQSGHIVYGRHAVQTPRTLWKIRDLRNWLGGKIYVRPKPMGVKAILRYDQRHLAAIISAELDAGLASPVYPLRKDILQTVQENSTFDIFGEFVSPSLDRDGIKKALRLGLEADISFIALGFPDGIKPKDFNVPYKVFEHPDASEIDAFSRYLASGIMDYPCEGVILEQEETVCWYHDIPVTAKVIGVDYEMNTKGIINPVIFWRMDGRDGKTFFTADEWQRLDPGIGDRLYLTWKDRRAPISIFKSENPRERISDVCPFCGFLMSMTEDGKACKNILCPGIIEANRLAFARRLGIDTTPAEEKKEFFQKEVLLALQVPNLENLVDVALEFFGGFDNLLSASFEEWTKVPCFNREMAKETSEWLFERKIWIQKNLENLNIRKDSWKSRPGRNSLIEKEMRSHQPKLSCSGTFFKGKQNILDEAKRLGFVVSKRKSPESTLFVAGIGSEEAVKYIRRFGIHVIDEKTWNTLVDKADGKNDKETHLSSQLVFDGRRRRDF